MLTKEAELELARRIQAGEIELSDVLVVENLRFVKYVAARYRSPRTDFDDLVAVGTLGLIEASKRYKPEKQVKFTSFAVWYVRKHILAEIKRQLRLAPHVPQDLDPTEPDLSKLDAALVKLTLEEQDLLAMTFGLWGCHQCGYDDIGKKKGVGPTRARQLIQRVLTKLRKLLQREENA